MRSPGNHGLQTIELAHHEGCVNFGHLVIESVAIRRPVDKPAVERAGGALKDTLLMPFRLLKAVFGYLNFFSMVYGKEPLRSAGGPRTPELESFLGSVLH